MVVEVMGRTAGRVALYAGVAGAGEVILIPGISYDLRRVADRIAERERLGARSSIVVVAEWAAPKYGSASVVTPRCEGRLATLGGVGDQAASKL